MTIKHITAAYLALMTATAAPAAVVSTLEQDGADLVWSYAGSVDFSATGTPFFSAPATLIDADQGLLVNLDPAANWIQTGTLTKNGVAHTGGFGSAAGNFFGTSQPGSAWFSIQLGSNSVIVDAGIPFGQNFSGAVRYENLSYSDLGITAADTGTYTLTWATTSGTDSASVTIAPIPVPAGLPLALAGLGGLALLRRRQSKP